VLDREIKNARLYKPERNIRIVSGGARGADTLARRYAYSRYPDIEYTEYKPDWEKQGKKAGMVRNLEIVRNSGNIIAFWNGKTAYSGTYMTINIAKKNKKPIKQTVEGIKKLNLGSGNKPYKDYTNCDLFPGAAVDEIFGLSEIPYEDNMIDAIHSEHALEHLLHTQDTTKYNNTI